MKKKGNEKEKKRRDALSMVYGILRFSVIVILVLQLFNRNYESAFLCALTLVLFLIPSFMERRFRIDIPNVLEIIILLFIYAAEILGEIRAFYITFPYWDTMLHTINGFLCAAVGFSLIDLLNRNKKIPAFSLSPFYCAVVAFCFSMTVGVIWEFFEAFMDHFFFLDMQKDTVVQTISSVMLDPAGGNSRQIIRGIEDTVLVLADGTERALGLGGYLDIGILDTMKDLFVNFIGAVCFSVIGYFYVKHRGKSKFAVNFIPRVVDDPVSPAPEDAVSSDSSAEK